MSDDALRYGSAGVDIDASNAAKNRIKKLVESTFSGGVVGEFGGFGGMFRLPPHLTKPILVSSADGVGTKIKVAIEADRHDTIGRDLVNHCVNDILVQGALPLFFLDYVAFGKLDPVIVEDVVAGVAAGCRENGCALIGGETVNDRLRLRLIDPFPGGGGAVADVLLAEHRSYLRALQPVLDRVHAMAHITGGGLPENVDRALPQKLDAVVEMSSWKVPHVFRVLQDAGKVEPAEMYRTFNMGVGMVVICAPSDIESVLSAATTAGVQGWIIGSLKPGTGAVILS